jgi:hypothetical protein
MKITAAGQDYEPSDAVVVASPRGESLHQAGTPELPCAACGAPCPVDERSRSLHQNHGLAVLCVWCAADLYPDMIAGEVGGRPVTIREWLAARVVGMRRAEVSGSGGAGDGP